MVEHFRRHVMAEIGVVMLLFTIGIEFSMAHLTATRRLLLIGGPLQVGSVVILAAIIGRFFGLSPGQAIFWGCLWS